MDPKKLAGEIENLQSEVNDLHTKGEDADRERAIEKAYKALEVAVRELEDLE